MIPLLCSKIGGIWCYWPNFSLIKILATILLILIILWILLNKNNRAGKKIKNN